MLVFVSLVSCRSTTDEFDFDATMEENGELWTPIGDYEYSGKSLILGSAGKGALVYNNKRRRKKWMLNFCGTIAHAELVFTQDPLTNLSIPSESVEVGITRSSKRLCYRVTLKQDRTLINSTTTIPERDSYSCFTMLSARGWISVLWQPPIGGNPPLLIEKVDIPRSYYFTLIGEDVTTITKLSFGDYFGGSRIEVPEETEWDMSIRDFL